MKKHLEEEGEAGKRERERMHRTSKVRLGGCEIIPDRPAKVCPPSSPLLLFLSPLLQNEKTDTEGCAKGYWHLMSPLSTFCLLLPLSQSNKVKGENEWNAAAYKTAGRTHPPPPHTPAGPPPLISQNQLVHLPRFSQTTLP